jgi:DNA replication ATP-dependent helicase Dna2
VVEDNVNVQNEILLFRNYIVTFLREIAEGNINFIENIETKLIEESFPKYDIDNANTFIDKLNGLSELEKAYFNLYISFVAKEMFAQKIGLYIDTTHKNNSNGFSSLWLNSIEEKRLSGSVISDLFLDFDNSDFNKMHLTFDKNKNDFDTINNYRTAFREGDICVMYPVRANDILQLLPTDNQLFRGRILELNDNFVKVSFRNKLSKKLFQKDCYWCLESDYMEKNNTILFNSISNFIFNDFENKNHILGITEPTFTTNKHLNEIVNAMLEFDLEKKEIILNALSCNNYFLIQGPPGTGKTSYILRYLTQILFNHTSENILLVAYTNRAVDEICSNFLKIKTIFPNFDFIRLGNKDNKYTAHLLSNIELDEIENRINNCRIFVSTVLTANSNPELFKIKNIDTIIVDEAAQILESHIIGLLSKAKRFIMIGDEKQLPPISILNEKYLNVDNELLNKIELNYLKSSLFERLLSVCKKNNFPAFALLSKQCRMSKQIMSLANNLFYDDKLVLGETDRKLDNFDFIDKKKDCFFINTPIESISKVNNAEIEIILKLIENIKTKINITPQTIGIISPWRMQCSAILNRLSDTDKNIISVDTVERFQGAERDIIIFSSATNSAYLLDILSNAIEIDSIVVDRKLNVAITRAKKKFILLGNHDILSQNSIYKKLISKLKRVEI